MNCNWLYFDAKGLFSLLQLTDWSRSFIKVDDSRLPTVRLFAMSRVVHFFVVVFYFILRKLVTFFFYSLKDRPLSKRALPMVSTVWVYLSCLGCTPIW